MGFEEVLIGDKRLAYFTLKQNLIYPPLTGKTKINKPYTLTYLIRNKTQKPEM